jgi:signal transduction histidine kinase
MKPVWIGDHLILARKVLANGEIYIQGLWLDWPRLKEWLLSQVSNLFPRADLRKALPGEGVHSSRRLASLPVLLAPGPIAFPPEEGWSPLLISLCIAWMCVILGMGTGAMLLKGVMALSERRAAFVSAVTHELRTPLTTFKMYTEMLAGGMVRDPEKQNSYLTTLTREADRLGHLVQNVLAYARLERSRMAGRMETITLGDLLERVTGRLEERVQQAGMALSVEPAAEDLFRRVRVDSSAVDQILFNLVDNSTKYARKAGDRTIHLGIRLSKKFAGIHIRDHGPGISPRESHRLFQPFSKSARDAANSAPGVGLGLSLSRRLARAMGGELELDGNKSDGACFVLRLPLS